MIFLNIFLKLCLVSSTIGSQIPLPLHKSVNYIDTSEKKGNLLNGNRSLKPQESNETYGDLSDSLLTCPFNKEVKLCSDVYPGKVTEMKESHRQEKVIYLKEFQIQKQKDEIQIEDIYQKSLRSGQDVGYKLKDSLKVLYVHYNQWMSTVPDSQLISHMSIPGTHMSVANDWRPFIGCQELSILEQLEVGIRFFDISLRLQNDDFTLVYGNSNLGPEWDLDRVLNDFLFFLTHHPTEVILLKFKQEYSTASGQDMLKVWNKRLGWVLGKMYLKSDPPTIGEVRGKIVIISQIDTIPGIPYNKISVQDEFIVSDYSKKVDQIKTHIERSVKTAALGKNELHINFLSGYYTPFHRQWIIASNILPMVADKIFAPGWPMFYGIEMFNFSRKENVHVHVGIIAMDFPNTRMIFEIIKLNANKHLLNHPVVQIVNAFSNPYPIFPSLYHFNSNGERIVYSDQSNRPALWRTTWVQIPLSATHYVFFNVVLKEYLYTNPRGELATWRAGKLEQQGIYELPKKNTSVLMLNTFYQSLCYEAEEGFNADIKYVWCKKTEVKKSVWRINPL